MSPQQSFDVMCANALLRIVKDKDTLWTEETPYLVMNLVKDIASTSPDLTLDDQPITLKFQTLLNNRSQ